MSRELSALAGLGPLGDLDLQLVGVHQIVDGDAEPPRGHLLDGAAPVGPEALFVLAAFAGVGSSADLVHGSGQRLVRLLADGAERHGAGGEPLHDLARRLDLFERHGMLPLLQLDQPTQRAQLAVLVVDQVRKLLERSVALLPDRVLQLADGLRIDQVILAAGPGLIVAAGVQIQVRIGDRAIRKIVLQLGFGRQDIQPHTLDARGCTREVLVHELLVETDGLEDLRSPVALEGGDPHLGEDLQQSLVDGFQIVVQGVLEADVEKPVLAHVLERLDRQIRVDGAGAKANQEGKMHDFAGLARFHDQRHLSARALPNQVMVHRRQRQQTGDRREAGLDAAVGEDQQRVSVPNGQRGAPAQPFQVPLEFLLPAIGTVDGRQRGGQEFAPGNAPQLLQIVIRQNRMRQLERVAVLRRLLEDVALGADVAGQRHDQLFANRVDGGIGHLRKKLLEVVKQRLRPVRQACQRCIRPHRAHRFLAGGRHRRENELEILGGVTENALPL